MGMGACECSNERVSVFSVCVFECISVDVCGEYLCMCVYSYVFVCLGLCERACVSECVWSVCSCDFVPFPIQDHFAFKT